MIYLKKFRLMNEDVHYGALMQIGSGLFDRYTPDEYYPLKFFHSGYVQRIEQIDFENITILYGGNGSGKTTLLNIIAEKVDAFRYKNYLQTECFRYYVSNCKYEYDKIPLIKKILASDDIFDHILTIREKNKEIKSRKASAYDFSDAQDLCELLTLQCEARKKTQRQFVRSRAGEMQRQFSNGENALMFFDKEIEKDALYLLDEPENSMSPKFQLELKTLIEDSVKYKNCQFVIATHSPFILSLFDAKIYNLDATPVTVERWHELENVRYYYDFFIMNKGLFASTII